jgi:hypothetical protein
MHKIWKVVGFALQALSQCLIDWVQFRYSSPADASFEVVQLLVDLGLVARYQPQATVLLYLAQSVGTSVPNFCNQIGESEPCPNRALIHGPGWSASLERVSSTTTCNVWRGQKRLRSWWVAYHVCCSCLVLNWGFGERRVIFMAGANQRAGFSCFGKSGCSSVLDCTWYL